MNKKIFLVIATVIATTATYAQFRLGPTAGFNINHQVWKSNTYRFNENPTNRFAFHIGMIGDLHITDFLSLQPELLYTQKGGYYKLDQLLVTEEYKWNLGYVSVPLLLTLKLDLKRVYMYAGAGPYLSVLAVSNYQYNQNGLNVENGKPKIGTDFTDDQLKPFDAGVKFKIGFEHKKGLFFQAFYDLGTADVNPQFTITHNKTIGAALGYIFSLTEEDRYSRFDKFYEF